MEHKYIKQTNLIHYLIFFICMYEITLNYYLLKFYWLRCPNLYSKLRTHFSEYIF